MKNNAIIDAILCFLKEHKNEAAKKQPDKDDLEGLHYIIGQTIRQYKIPKVKKLQSDNLRTQRHF